jgi:hypothetical protein
VLKKGSVTEPKAACNVFYILTPTKYYHTAILVKGAPAVDIMSAVGPFSTYGIDHVSLVNNATLTSQSYFRNLCCITAGYKSFPQQPPIDQMSYEKSVNKEHLERSFYVALLSIDMPATIHLLLKFKIVQGNLQHELYLAHPKLSIRAFIKWCKEAQVFNCNMASPLYLKYTGTVENTEYHRGG